MTANRVEPGEMSGGCKQRKAAIAKTAGNPYMEYINSKVGKYKYEAR
jgi:hypothetical protein